jgi:hypothetical protein
MTTRSVLAVLALMIASATGGFLYSELIKQGRGEDMRAMREELKELKELTARVASEQTPAPRVELSAPAPIESRPGPVPAMARSPQVVESAAYVPACRKPAAGACAETDAQQLALCATVPARARVEGVDLFVQADAVQTAWDEHRVRFEQDLGGARFTGGSFEYPQGENQKAVCVNFMHWSADHSHIARILVRYGEEAAPELDSPAEVQRSPAQSPAVIAADALTPFP